MSFITLLIGADRSVQQAYLPIVASSTRASTLHYCCNDKAFAWGPVGAKDHLNNGVLVHSHAHQGKAALYYRLRCLTKVSLVPQMNITDKRISSRKSSSSMQAANGTAMLATVRCPCLVFFTPSDEIFCSHSYNAYRQRWQVHSRGCSCL